MTDISIDAGGREMKAFEVGQRVFVRVVAEYNVNAWGVVQRLRHGDNRAWVHLDTRASDTIHPFPADDPKRATSVLAFPEDCDEFIRREP
jgi:hypothetical protein